VTTLSFRTSDGFRVFELPLPLRDRYHSVLGICPKCGEKWLEARNPDTPAYLPYSYPCFRCASDFPYPLFPFPLEVLSPDSLPPPLLPYLFLYLFEDHLHSRIPNLKELLL